MPGLAARLRGHDALERLPRRGDISLTYKDLGTGETAFFRLLRRIGDPVEPRADAEAAAPGERPLPEPPPVEEDERFRDMLRELEQGF